MFFTKNDFEKIAEYLKANSMKDTDFPKKESVSTSSDILTIVSGGNNYKISISDLLKSGIPLVTINKLTAIAIEVLDIEATKSLTVDASKILLNNTKGTTLLDVLDYFEANKVDKRTDNTINGNLTINKDLTVNLNSTITGNLNVDKNIKLGNNTISSSEDKITVHASLKTTGDITDGNNNILSDVNAAAKGYRILQVTPTSDLIKDEYKLFDYQNNLKGSSIKIYKDSAILNVYLGTVGDITNPITGDITYGTGDTALCILYIKVDGKYELVKVNVEEFLTEAEFGDGLKVVGHHVSIKLSEDDESSAYLHFDEEGALTINGIRNYMDAQLGTKDESTKGDGTIWGTYKEHEGTLENSLPSNGSRWGEFKASETLRNLQVSDEIDRIQAKVDEVNLKTIKDALDNALQAIVDRETEILTKTDASLISVNTSGLSGNNVQSNLNDTSQKLRDLSVEVSELDSEVNEIYSITKEKLGYIEIKKGNTTSRSLSVDCLVSKGDTIHIKIIEDGQSHIFTLYQDEWGGKVIAGMTSMTEFDYIAPNDFSKIVFYNDNSANGYSVEVSLIKNGLYKEVEDKIIDNVIEDVVSLTASTNYDAVSRFQIDALKGKRVYRVKIDKGTANILKWYAYCYDNGYKKIEEQSIFSEYVDIVIPDTFMSVTSFGIYIFGDDITASGEAKISYKFNSEYEDRFENIETHIKEKEKELEREFGYTLTSEGNTSNRSLTLEIDCKKDDVIHIKIEESNQSHQFTIYQDVWGGKVIAGKTSQTEFDYVAPNNFTKIVFYNDNSASGYSAKASIEKKGRVGDMEVDVTSLKASSGTIDSTDHLIALSENPLSVIRRDSGFAAMFHSWGFIGDSLCSGEHNAYDNGEKKYVDLYEYSWGQCICRMCGTEGFNFSEGGQSAKGWVLGKKGDGITPTSMPERTWVGAKTNLKDAYIIALGVNDCEQSQSTYTEVGNVTTDIGTYNPSTDTDTNANTFAGYYAGIIQRLKSVQPKCKIFCVTLPKGDRTLAESYSNVIRSMETLFSDVYTIDLYNYGIRVDGEWANRYRQEYHLNAAGYLYTAWEFMTYIDWIVRNNWRKFNNVAFIGTDYTDTKL